MTGKNDGTTTVLNPSNRTTGDRSAEVVAPKFTPGPWVVGPYASNVFAEDHKGIFPICDIRGWGHFTGNGHGALGLPAETALGIQRANATLIAAAPKMLAALQRARIHAPLIRLAPERRHVIEILDAAIAEALNTSDEPQGNEEAVVP